MKLWKKLSFFFERKTIEKADQITKKVIKESKEIESLVTKNKKTVDSKTAISSKPLRARTKKGTFVADDKSTENINEAWEGGFSPTKPSKKKPKIVRKKKSR
jgi:hypothetical protein|tara:strand:- start:6372 stop:6677 length:306 start_codon:yes stop_codon:yes gene_type:complete